VKYRQRGYRESERRDERDQRPPPQQRQQLTEEERIQRRSMRKATSREANEVVRCHVCGRNVDDGGTIGLESRCPHCSAPLHCCRACAHFDTAARWQCRTEIKAAVPDKTKPNTCRLFRPRLVLDFTGRRGSGQRGAAASDPRAQFESLFKR
jgi:hypothetical protein